MAIDYTRMRATAKRLLTDNGMQYAVTRKGSIKVVAGKEVREPDLNFTAIGVRTEYDPREIDGSNIQAGDVAILFTWDEELRIGDLVEVDSKPHRIVHPHPVKPGPIVICYQAQLRA